MSAKIFGREWEEIEAMQRGERVGRAVPMVDTRPRASERDRRVLEERGLEWLVANRMWGIIDRLIRSGVIEDKEYWNGD